MAARNLSPGRRLHTTTTYHLNSCAFPDSRDSTGLRQATISPPHLRQPAIAPTLREHVLTVPRSYAHPPAQFYYPCRLTEPLRSSHARGTANAGASRQDRLTSVQGRQPTKRVSQLLTDIAIERR